MARAHGRVLSSIWEDEDFIALTQQQQRLYLFLISQPNLNHAGLLPLTLRRWARKAMGLTAAELDEHLDALAKAHFIVLDEDTEELLIRSFVRNDGVWRMPKVMGAMVSGALEIESKALRRALLDEMDRIPLDDLSDEPTKTTRGEGPSIRAQVVDHITTLRKAFGNPGTPPPQGGSGTPSAPPSRTPSGTPSDTPPEGDEQGGPKGSTRGRAGAHVRAAPSPTPAPALSPTPDPLPSVADEGEETSGSSARDAERPDGLPLAPIDIDGFTVTDSMLRWANDVHPHVDLQHSTHQFIAHYRSTGTRRKNWPEAWRKWIAEDAHRGAGRPRQGAFLVGLPGGNTSRQQQETDDMFDRAMARAEARMQQESS
jgi:hypothetical protein